MSAKGGQSPSEPEMYRTGRTSTGAFSIAQAQNCVGVVAQSIREIAPRGLAPIEIFLLAPGERLIGVKNIRRLARKPCRKALRRKAPFPTILKTSQLGSQHCRRVFAILQTTQQRRNLFCNYTLHGTCQR